jgi:hypothetical protein
MNSYKIILIHVPYPEVEGRTEPDPRMKVPMPDFIQSESRFTPSEILLQKLASKCAWTEAEIVQVINLLRSPGFNVEDIGLELSKKVNLFHTISYYFIFCDLSVMRSARTRSARLDINLLKPERLLVAPRGNVISLRNAAAVTGWVQYQPRLQCPLLRYLPHFLATFIFENLDEALHLPAPPPIKPRQSSYEDQKGRK